ncbi:hypothetical protein EUU23_10725 [Sphingorhabdus sp. IMCC26285]|uniref:Uncharacterized protein n=1 Tax=Sphingorhabdus profundilacus TaxID=2509718 RepID=A0A6I4LX80_9SPHN|nr:hypothetical protein [Sphingorhabdus profundilacus]MVZ98167.1 hypothetical protein [Sphingorhabdus profundilacus]
MQHIFYSWQADTPSATCKNLIGRALQDAIDTLNADAEIEGADRHEDPRAAILDHDTAGVPGSPPIVETIFRKIDGAAIFISDLTYVAERRDGRRSPNPNVLFEHGWAWKSLSWRAVISVMNIAHGDPKNHPLPFDLQHSRGPILFDCPDDATVEQRRAARAGLAKALVPKLRAIFDDDVLKAARVPAAPVEPHPHDLELVKRWQALLTEPVRRFLREQNFGDVYVRKNVDALHEINDTWRGAKFEFDDPELQRAFQEFLAANAPFCRQLVERTYVLDNNAALASPKTTVDQQRGIQQSTFKAIERLNELATLLNDAIDAFERQIRARIRLPLEPSSRRAPEIDPRWDSARQGLVKLATDRTIGGVPRIVSRPCFVMMVVPLAAFEGERLAPASVTEAQLRFPPDPHIRIEEGSDARQWWVCALPESKGGPNPETAWLARIVRPGLLEAQVNIGARIDDDSDIIIDGGWLERHIVGWYERLCRGLAPLGLAGPGIVGLSLHGTEDVILMRSRPGGRKIVMPEIHLATLEVADLSEPIAPALQEAFDIMWQASGWRDGSPSYGSGTWSGYSAHDASAARG